VLEGNADLNPRVAYRIRGQDLRQVLYYASVLYSEKEQRMSAKVDSNIAANARAKLERLQKSSKYRSFFNVDAIDAFSKVEGTAFAGMPLTRTKDLGDPSPRD
jgi:hypothetical protein